MNDVTVNKAETKAVGKDHDLHVVVVCNSNHMLNYVLTGLDKSGEPSAFKQTIIGGSPYITTGYRVDKAVAEVSNHINPSTENVTYLVGPRGSAAAGARELTLRLTFTDGTDTFSIDQSDEQFQKVAGPCAKKPAVAQPTPVSTPIASATAPTEADPIPLDAEMNREYAAQMQQEDWKNRERELDEGSLDPNGTMM